ncbi:MAG: OB-fold nucleic acid binding domain-containing protein, partial [Bryobacteraceae bacterium]
PKAYRRAHLNERGVARAVDLAAIPSGRRALAAGCVIVRQRPGTAKGFVFLSLEDETGIANIIVEPATFDQYRAAITSAPFVLVEGVVQKQDGVVSIKARDVQALEAGVAALSHDFH